MKLLTLRQHRELFENAGYSDIQMIDEPAKGWVCAMGRKPLQTNIPTFVTCVTSFNP